jgi:hypothetical protein
MIREINSNDLLTFLVVVVVFIALANLAITFTKVSDIRQEMTGRATGYVNLTINTQLNIALYNETVWWGEGVVNASWEGETLNYANLTTHADATSTIIGGNWSTNDASGITIANIGNINCSLTLQSDNNASDLFDSETTGLQTFQWNVSEKEAGACGGGNGDEQFEVFIDVNKTAAGTYCNQFGYLPGKNELFFDFHLQVPHDAQNTGHQIATITVTGDTAV